MKHFWVACATLWLWLLVPNYASGQSTLNEGAMLTVEASSVVLFSDSEVDKGADNPMGTLTVIAGYRISPYLSAGLGFGFDMESESDVKYVTGNGLFNEGLTSTVSTPLSIQVRGDLMPDAKVCPYIAASIGYRASLVRTDDEQKILFYQNREKIDGLHYERFYNAGMFAELTAGVSIPLGGHRIQLGASLVNYNRKNTSIEMKKDGQSYKTTDKAHNGASFKLGISF